MKGFSGFPDGALLPIPLPALFFSELLPIIDHMGELQVILFGFWSLQSQEGQNRYLRLSHLAQEKMLLQILSTGQPHTDPQQLLRESLERAVARGILLRVQLEWDKGQDDFFFMNTEKGRLLVELIQKGEWSPIGEDKAANLLVQRPNIFVLFEQNIGPLTPLIADQLRDLEKEYSAQWVEEAIKQAAFSHVNSLNYIIGVLKRWQRDGRPTYTTQKKLGGDTS
jgi:DnaD/phage-associated family protein